jgi:hypothetical protein
LVIKAIAVIEISREVTMEAKKQGIELIIEKPLL